MRAEKGRVAKPQINSLLASLFFVACLFPFVSPFPIDTDTQPVYLIIASIIVFRAAVTTGLKLDQYQLLGIALLSMGYLNISYDYSVDMGKYVSLMAGALTFIAASKIGPSHAYRLLKIAIIVYFTYSVLISLNSAFFLSFQEKFVRNINVADISNLAYRGVPTLATEPGLLGGLLVFFLIQLRYYGLITNAPAREFALYGLLILIMVFMTKSGTGYLYLFLFLFFTFAFHASRYKFRKIVFLGVSLFSFVYLFNRLGDIGFDNRGIEILGALVSGGALDADTSVLKRIYDIRIGLQSLVDYPFGVGANAVGVAVNELATKYDFIRPNDIPGDISLVSGLSYYLVSYGLFGLAVIACLFLYLSRAPALHKIFALIFMCASYSPAFPAIWILLSQKPINKSISTG